MPSLSIQSQRPEWPPIIPNNSPRTSPRVRKLCRRGRALQSSYITRHHLLTSGLSNRCTSSSRSSHGQPVLLLGRTSTSKRPNYRTNSRRSSPSTWRSNSPKSRISFKISSERQLTEIQLYRCTTLMACHSSSLSNGSGHQAGRRSPIELRI